jgi:hypothetical protein
VPKIAFFFKDSTQWNISGVTINGNYPYASYDENTTTGQWGVLYDPPPSSNGWKPSAVLDGNYINSCIQGIGIGNFGDTAKTSGVSISGNSFVDCWDHAVYLTMAESTAISGNSMLNCRRPIVVDGTGCSVIGNTLYADATNQLNHEQLISVRDCKYATITGNTIYGVGAGIDASCVTGTEIIGNVIANNVLTSTANSVYLAESIRVGASSTTCTNNIVSNNAIVSRQTGANSVINLQCTSGAGESNKVTGNTILLLGATPIGIGVDRQNNCFVSGNTVSHEASSASPAIFVCVYLNASTRSYVADNYFVKSVNGTNFTARGVQVTASCVYSNIQNNRAQFSASGVTPAFLVDSGTLTYPIGNQADISNNLVGKCTIPSGATNIQVFNSNILSSSIIIVTPANADAGLLAATPGIFATSAAGTFYIYTADFSNAPAACTFNYEIR